MTRNDSIQALRTLGNLVRGRIPIPLSLLRAQAAKLADKVDLSLTAESPGLRLRGRAEALGAPIDFSLRIDVSGIEVRGEERTVRLRLTDVELSTSEDAPGPLAEAIRAGKIDTSQPASLLGNMTSRPPYVLEAEGDTVVIDLMRVPALAQDERLASIAGAATSILGVRDVVVDENAVGIRLSLLPGGAKEAAMSAARLALLPAVKTLWPSRSRRP